MVSVNTFSLATKLFFILRGFQIIMARRAAVIGKNLSVPRMHVNIFFG